MLCEEIMKRNAHHVSPRDAVLLAAETMRRENIGFLPVCDDDGRVIGTLTDRDIVLRLVADNRPADLEVGDIMTHEVVSCRPTDNIQLCEQQMATHHKSRVVCCDEDGRLMGVISLSDIAKWDNDRVAPTIRRIVEREVARA